MVKINISSSIIVCLFLVSCTAALPPKRTETLCSTSLKEAQIAASEARKAADEARQALAEAEKMYIEAKVLARHAKKGGLECATLVNKVEAKQKALKRRRRVYSHKKKQSKPKAKNVIEENNSSGSTREPKYPKYSPSDAPVGWQGS